MPTAAEPLLPTEPLLQVRDLRTWFLTDSGPVRAVDGVSFDVHAGETLGVVGESGSGKSVCAKSIMRLLDEPARIVGGSILFKGRDLAHLDDEGIRAVRGREIAMVFQDPMTSLNPVLRIARQLIEAMTAHGRFTGTAARRRAIDLLRRMGVASADRTVNSFPHQFSGGMRQRVMLAMGFSNEPSLLIADEPTTALDVTIQAQYLELLKEVQRSSGVAVILVTHDFGIVAANADRVAVMYAGKIVEMGSTHQVFDKPGHPYTRALLRCLPDVELRRERLVEIGGQPPDLAQLPPGCPFAPRCPERQPICHERYPPSVSVDNGHVAHCWVASAGHA
jgi:oligopeptide/dipeptide ABC transporter ATP-binding protein